MSTEVCVVDGDWTRTKRLTPWYDDGNVVLVAADCSALYRVHRGILCSYSSIFRDMFTASCGGPEEIERCPVVHLTDSAEDLQHVLRAFYDRSYCSSSDDEVPIAVVAAFLRLGKKYDIPHLFQEAKSRMVADFPSSFTAFHSGLTENWKVTSPWEVTLSKDIIFAMINLAREMDFHVVLPAAYYMCLGYCSLEEILTGARDETGEVVQVLSPEARQTCALATEPFWSLSNETFSFLRIECDTQSISCADATKDFLLRCFFPVSTVAPLDDIPEDVMADLCEVCALRASESHQTNRVAVWNRLPGIFGLPDWDKIREYA
ncbi:hypothetical protein CONPUDRAFT_138082 [Coniophora puteana RWD-64-598 SS2]|uniref:BTB domain-containing protein n=1 Tax=Coniophora puteana (strain RWD-64-598) TaxID=741705 RepID=A0A5M3MLM6_CONPW|nr:uncharacterized protein CONPUDRAFT_138082 [Coniophora puteana RWD-64-598 SS2]EIW79937.1 hypothetical protein CONPUDRAFT_138082 [Coniophora puteana RWD-64-598 SS2]